jgi:hypothetical protein
MSPPPFFNTEWSLLTKIQSTVATEPYCNVGTFMGLGVEAVWCDSTYYTGGSIIPIYTTYTGQLSRVFTNPTSSAAPTTTSSTSIFSTYTTPTTTTSTQTSITSTTPAPTHTLQPNSTPVGPIVGGVIGGLALIAAIAAGIFFCLRQNRKDKQTTYAPEIQTYTQNNNTHSQQPSEKYPATAQATFIPAGYTPPSATPGQQIHYQQPPQPQYQQPPPVIQPSYNVYPPPQQPPQPTGNYLEQQQPTQQPIQQAQQHHPENFQAQSRPPVQPQTSALDAQRGSVASSISTPGSPAPPSYRSKIPAVPEMTGVTDHHASPIDDRYEMPM